MELLLLFKLSLPFLSLKGKLLLKFGSEPTLVVLLEFLSFRSLACEELCSLYSLLLLLELSGSLQLLFTGRPLQSCLLLGSLCLLFESLRLFGLPDDLLGGSGLLVSLPLRLFFLLLLDLELLHSHFLLELPLYPLSVHLGLLPDELSLPSGLLLGCSSRRKLFFSLCLPLGGLSFPPGFHLLVFALLQELRLHPDNVSGCLMGLHSFVILVVYPRGIRVPLVLVHVPRGADGGPPSDLAAGSPSLQWLGESPRLFLFFREFLLRGWLPVWLHSGRRPAARELTNCRGRLVLEMKRRDFDSCVCLKVSQWAGLNSLSDAVTEAELLKLAFIESWGLLLLAAALLRAVP